MTACYMNGFCPRPDVAAAATAKAVALLIESLSPAQRSDFHENGYFIVIGASGQRYRIDPSFAFNVHVINADGSEGDVLCGAPKGAAPTPDVMLAQKLWLEADDLTFCKVANRGYRWPDGYLRSVPRGTTAYLFEGTPRTPPPRPRRSRPGQHWLLD